MNQVQHTKDLDLEKRTLHQGTLFPVFATATVYGTFEFMAREIGINDHEPFVAKGIDRPRAQFLYFTESLSELHVVDLDNKTRTYTAQDPETLREFYGKKEIPSELALFSLGSTYRRTLAFSSF